MLKKSLWWFFKALLYLFVIYFLIGLVFGTFFILLLPASSFATIGDRFIFIGKAGLIWPWFVPVVLLLLPNR